MPTIQLIKPNDASIHVEFRQVGEGPDLLLLHSLLTEMTVFAPLLPELARAHRVTLVNLPGYGASAPVRLDGLEALADYLAQTLEALHLPASTEVFGSGLGAALGLLLAQRHPGRVRRLVAAGAAARFSGAARAPFRVLTDAARRGGMGSVFDVVQQHMVSAAFCAAQPQVLAARRAALAMVDRDCFIRACHALAQMELSARLPELRLPTLVLCGTQDRITPPALAQEVARAIPGADYRQIPDCGHCPVIEQPAMLISLIEAFRATR